MQEPGRLKEYRMKKVYKYTNNHAIFFNTVDTLDRKKEEEFLINREVLNKYYDQDDSVRYYFNSLGYRSDEFTKFHDGEHVLFAGCSETEGVGGNLDSCWSYMTYKKLSETGKISGFFNLSRAGWGHDVIIANIIQYINTYGKPSKIYMLLPNLSRGFEWKGLNDEVEMYEHSQKTPYFFLKDTILPDGSRRDRQSLEEQRIVIINFINLLKLFEEYCISNNIELVWSTWVIPDGQNYKTLNVFKNFIQMDPVDQIFSKGNRLFDGEMYSKKNLLYKRDGHLGYLYHHWWSQRFLGLIDTNDV
jgi:hypothetical protein